MRMISYLCRFAGVLSAILFTAAALVICYEVLLRYLGIPTRWAQDLAVYFMIGGAFLGQGAVMLDDAHVRVDVFIRMMSDRLRVFCVRLTLAIGLIYTAAMTWEGYVQSSFSREIGRMSTSLFRIPTWIPEAAIPIGFGLLSLAILYQIIRPKIATVEDELNSFNEL
jgi:TRAP-type C4-dicarboxylate transport system permease small subunit